MSPLTTILVALGLAADAFSVALGYGAACEHRPLQGVRMAASFGLFQGIMPVLGWLLGAHVVSLISAWDHWIAFGLLLGVGSKMIIDALRPHHEPVKCDRSRGWHLLVLSVATSIDALGVGVGLGIKGAAIAVPCLVIAVTAFALSCVGYHLGRRVSARLGREAGIAGGLIIIGIGVRMLWL